VVWTHGWMNSKAGHKCQLERPLIRQEVSHGTKRPAIQLVSSETAIPACHIPEVRQLEACRFDLPSQKFLRYSSKGAFINRSTVDTVL
jgi:hypothetical protein